MFYSRSLRNFFRIFPKTVICVRIENIFVLDILYMNVKQFQDTWKIWDMKCLNEFWSYIHQPISWDFDAWAVNSFKNLKSQEKRCPKIIIFTDFRLISFCITLFPEYFQMVRKWLQFWLIKFWILWEPYVASGREYIFS